MSVTAQIDGNVKAGGDMHEANTEGPLENGLNSGVFPEHPRSGFYFSMKGEAMTPWELTVLESTAEGDSRHQAVTTSPSWDSTTIVSTGETKGVGIEGGPETLGLPNH